MNFKKYTFLLFNNWSFLLRLFSCDWRCLFFFIILSMNLNVLKLWLRVIVLLMMMMSLFLSSSGFSGSFWLLSLVVVIVGFVFSVGIFWIFPFLFSLPLVGPATFVIMMS